MNAKTPDPTPFRILPDPIPNSGILFVDHQVKGRSGHAGNTVTECRNGDIVAFYSNTSGCEDAIKGHSTAGWTEYRRSTDGGQTWGAPVILNYSKRMWEGTEMFSALVWASITAPDGTLLAILPRFLDKAWRRKLPPVCLLSTDHGETWSEPTEIDPDATVDELAVSFDACFVHADTIYIMFSGGVGGMGPGPYTLYVSRDNGRSFEKRSTLPFAHQNYYGTITRLDDGRIIAYSYPTKGAGIIIGFNQGDGSSLTNEHNLHYTISEDDGQTWSEVRTTLFAKRLRNPQMSDKIGDYYFMHGRAGSYGADRGKYFVLYSSKDGIHWDEGRYLHENMLAPPGGGGDKYSANEIIGKYDDSRPRRLLIQSSITYDPNSSCVNERHWWIDRIAGEDPEAACCETLHAAAAAGNVGEVERHLRAGAAVYGFNDDGLTPLVLAIKAGHLETAACLVRHGADVNTRCKYGKTPLHHAIRAGCADLVDWLLNQGAAIHDKEWQVTFLPSVSVAAESGQIEVLKRLLQRGADIEAEDNDNATPIFLAAQHGRLDVVDYLLEQGARTDKPDTFGRLPADVAEIHDHPEVAARLRAGQKQ
jgi:hypothetical protein